jgi:hypothetical protein
MADNTVRNHPTGTDHRIKLYALAAAAAGVSVLALAQPAESEVVFTKRTIPLPGTVFVDLSMNNDGVSDFSFYLSSFAYHSANRALYLKPMAGGGAVGNGSAWELAPGAKVGPSAHFDTSAFVRIERSHANFGYTSRGRFTYTKTIEGKWGNNPTDRYLGVRFLINGETHYGWIRLTVNTAPRGALTATINSYAYESVPNKMIVVGATSSAGKVGTDASSASEKASPSLGALALGAEGLPIWRQ